MEGCAAQAQAWVLAGQTDHRFLVGQWAAQAAPWAVVQWALVVRWDLVALWDRTGPWVQVDPWVEVLWVQVDPTQEAWGLVA